MLGILARRLQFLDQAVKVTGLKSCPATILTGHNWPINEKLWLWSAPVRTKLAYLGSIRLCQRNCFGLGGPVLIVGRLIAARSLGPDALSGS